MKYSTGKLAKIIYLALIYSFIYTPILVVVVYSFNASRFSLSWSGFSWHWYYVLFRDPKLLTVAWHSFVLATLAASLAVFLGSLAALCLHRYQFLGRHWLQGLIFILIVAPDIVLGIALLLLTHILPIPLGFWSLFLSHTTFCLPFVVVTLYSRLSSLNVSIFESAKDLGASEFTLFRRVLIPLLMPALIAAWVLSFTLSVDDVVISYFVSGPSYQILPLKVYSMARHGVTPEINALSTIMLLLTFLVLAIIQAVRWKQS